MIQQRSTMCCITKMQCNKHLCHLTQSHTSAFLQVSAASDCKCWSQQIIEILVREYIPLRPFRSCLDLCSLRFDSCLLCSLQLVLPIHDKKLTAWIGLFCEIREGVFLPWALVHPVQGDFWIHLKIIALLQSEVRPKMGHDVCCLLHSFIYLCKNAILASGKCLNKLW